MNTLALLLAAIEIISPVGDDPVKLVTDHQKQVMAGETVAARMETIEKNPKFKKLSWRESEPVVFKWRVTAGEGGTWQLEIGKQSDLSDARREVFEHPHHKDGVYRYELPRANLEVATRYYYRLTANLLCDRNSRHGRRCECTDRRRPVATDVLSFITEDQTPRWIAIEGRVSNMRDLGGWKTVDGRRVKQGILYRGQGLNDNSGDREVKGRNRLTVEDRQYLTGTLGIKTDLDLRSKAETADLETSPLGADVKLVLNSSSAYGGIFSRREKEVEARNFRLCNDPERLPLYFHCIAGADRTGALAYLLNGLLGVSRHDLETDWEMTFYPKNPHQPHHTTDELYEGFMKFGEEGDPLSRRIELYLKSAGVTDEEIAAFRARMLEDR